MRIGIIGAGQIGGTLTRRLRALGHEVVVANSRDPDSLTELATATGARAAWAHEVPSLVELVIVAIPEGAVERLPQGLFDGVPLRIPVVDTGNYYPRERDGTIADIEAGMPESQWVSQTLGRPVIKAFNTLHAGSLMGKGMPHGAQGRIAVPVAGDDAQGKQMVMQLIDQLGFDPIDAGSLAESWRQQPGTPIYGAQLNVDDAKAALIAARRERPAAYRGDTSGARP